MFVRLGFSSHAASYMTRACGLDSLDEVKYMDTDDNVETMIKRVNRPGGSNTTGTGNNRVTTPNNGFTVSIRAEGNLKLCVFYLKHMERVQRTPTASSITLEMVRGYREQQQWEDDFKKTAAEPEINDKDWPRTLESIREYLAAQYGVKGSTLDYVIRTESTVKPDIEDPVEDYLTIDLEMTARAPHTG